MSESRRDFLICISAKNLLQFEERVFLWNCSGRISKSNEILGYIFSVFICTFQFIPHWDLRFERAGLSPIHA